MSNISTLAGIIQGEAATPEDQFGVASTIYNRASAGTFPGGSDPLGVATAPGQFSAYPNAMQTPSANATALATSLVNGDLPSLGSTGNATYYNAAGFAYPSLSTNSYGPSSNAYSDIFGQSPSSNFQLPQLGGSGLSLANTNGTGANDLAGTSSFADPLSGFGDVAPFSDTSSAFIDTAGGYSTSGEENVAGSNLAAQASGNYALGNDLYGENDPSATSYYNTSPFTGSLVTDGSSATGSSTLVGNIGENADVNLADYAGASAAMGATDNNYSIGSSPSFGLDPTDTATNSDSGITATLSEDSSGTSVGDTGGSGSGDVAAGIPSSTAGPASPNVTANASTVPAAINQQTQGAATDTKTLAGATTAAANATNTTDTGIAGSVENWASGLFVRFAFIIVGLIFTGAGLYMLAPKGVQASVKNVGRGAVAV